MTTPAESPFFVVVFGAGSGYTPCVVVRTRHGDLVATMPFDGEDLAEVLPDWRLATEGLSAEPGVTAFIGAPSTKAGWLTLWAAAIAAATQKGGAPMRAFAVAAAPWVAADLKLQNLLIVQGAVWRLDRLGLELRPQLHVALGVLVRAAGPWGRAALVADMRCAALRVIERGCERPDEVARIVNEVIREVDALDVAATARES